MEAMAKALAKSKEAERLKNKDLSTHRYVILDCVCVCVHVWHECAVAWRTRVCVSSCALCVWFVCGVSVVYGARVCVPSRGLGVRVCVKTPFVD